ncbi:MAG: AMP-binding protein, partial [Moorea sp. SIO3G5]|nr:AMP-binding protein [Moorena sp. SIO3G5]
ATDTIVANGQDLVPLSVTQSSLAFLQYTSGSTGRPKGVMVTHGNIIHNQQLIQTAFGHSEQSIVVGWLPLFHDMGLIGNVLQPMYLGIPCILMPPVAFLQKPIRWLKAISNYRATTSGGPNFAYDLCLKKVQPEQLAFLDLSSWDLAYSGAEPVRAETLKKFGNKFANCGFNYRAFYPCYGMAETTLFATGGAKNKSPVIQGVLAGELEQNSVVETEISSDESRVFVGVGRPYLNTTVIIVNPESLTPCEPGQVGEIWVSGESLASGYWNRPEATQETFQAYVANTGEGPFLRTGDLGFQLNGELFVTGRLKDVIIIRGRNHYPQDLELTLENSHPALRSHCSAAFSVERSGEERLVVACELERTYLRNLNTEEVVKILRKAVSEEHDLQLYAVVLLKTGSIPKTSSGKIQRHACRTGFLNGSLDVAGEWMTNLEEVDLSHLHKELEMQLEQGKNGVTQKLFSDPPIEFKDDLSNQKSVPTEEEIEVLLTSHLAHHLNVLPDEIDVNESFADYGLDSSVAVSTTGDLAEWLGYELEPTLFWEYPNIKAIALYLAEEPQSNSQVTFEKEV